MRSVSFVFMTYTITKVVRIVNLACSELCFLRGVDLICDAYTVCLTANINPIHKLSSVIARFPSLALWLVTSVAVGGCGTYHQVGYTQWGYEDGRTSYFALGYWGNYGTGLILGILFLSLNSANLDTDDRRQD